MNEKMLISHTARTYTHMATDIAHKLQGGSWGTAHKSSLQFGQRVNKVRKAKQSQLDLIHI